MSAGASAGGAGVVLLAAPCPATNVIYHALAAEFGVVEVVLEQPVPRWRLARRRLHTLGAVTVFGQVLFSALVAPVLERRGRERVASIVRDNGLDTSPIPGPVSKVASVNSGDARRLLQRLDPSVVVVSGTRIISSATLDCVEAPFVNVHAGVTPQYRGVHGGYWALAEGRPHLAGTTVHLLDPGIDTGAILAQDTFRATGQDSFATYPYLHLAAGVPSLVATVAALVRGEEARAVPALDGHGPSRLRTHPTLWGYAAGRWRRSVP